MYRTSTDRRVPDFGKSVAVLLLVAVAFLVFSGGIAYAVVIDVPAGDAEALISAIEHANQGPELVTLNLQGGTYTLHPGLPGVPFIADGYNGLPSITTPIQINGNGARISRDTRFDCNFGRPPEDFRIFHVAPEGVLVLIDLSVQNGCAEYGGGLFNRGVVEDLVRVELSSNVSTRGGGIMNMGEEALLVMSSSILYENQSQQGGGLSNEGGEVYIRSSDVRGNISWEDAGGLFNRDGTLRVESTNFSGNQAERSGGGLLNVGAASVHASTFDANIAAEDGGGVWNAASVEVSTTSFGRNLARHDGGGIFNEGTAEIYGSTFATNRAEGDGGAVYNTAELAMTNSTLSGNYAGTSGGGLINIDAGSTTIVSSTLASNEAQRGANIANIAELQIQNSLVAYPIPVFAGDCANVGTWNASGGNLSTDGTCPNFNLPNADPLLNDLQDNGGPTLTRSLQIGSPAQFSADGCPPPATDQRGVPRPYGPSCDLGAYESTEERERHRDGHR